MSLTEQRTDRRLAIAIGLRDLLRENATMAHADGARFMPSSEYLDPVRNEEERMLLRRVPVVVAHSGSLIGAGAYVADDVAGVPVLVVRQAEGTARTFLNSCSHRGAKLVADRGTVGARISCPYHAWSYAIDGSLLSVTAANSFGPVDMGCHGLVEFPCEERYGLVFAILDPSATLDLDAFLGGFGPVLEALELGPLVELGQWVLEPGMNWKIAISTYLESYHVRVLHKNSVGRWLAGDHSVHESYGPHQLIAWPYRTLRDHLDLDDRAFQAVVAEQPLFAQVLFLYPNVVMTLDGVGPAEKAHLIRIYPGSSVDEQRTDYRILGDALPDEAAKRSFDVWAATTIDALIHEDYATVPHSQTVLATGLRKGLHFGANEAALTEVHRAWARDLGRVPSDQPFGGAR